MFFFCNFLGKYNKKLSCDIIFIRILIDTKIYYYYMLLNCILLNLLFINDNYATLLFACILLNLLFLMFILQGNINSN